ncbi:MAG: hypothetical protein U1F43_21455 [Myxococcota bacterium]
MDERVVIEGELSELATMGSANVAIGLRADLTIAFTNAAWDAFADANDGDPAVVTPASGNILDAMTPGVRRFYRELFTRVLRTGRPETHLYKCPSPTHSREFALRVTPHGSGLLLTHHLLVEEVAQETPRAPDGTRYRRHDGTIVQCWNCRMTRRGADEASWDWVPAWVAHAPDGLVSELCPTCYLLDFETMLNGRSSS